MGDPLACTECGRTDGEFYRKMSNDSLCGECFDRINDAVSAEQDERAFIAALRAESGRPDGFGLVDDGTMDTVLLCPKCDGWLRFDGREAAIDFLESDRECWLCDTESED